MMKEIMKINKFNKLIRKDNPFIKDLLAKIIKSYKKPFQEKC